MEIKKESHDPRVEFSIKRLGLVVFDSAPETLINPALTKYKARPNEKEHRFCFGCDLKNG